LLLLGILLGIALLLVLKVGVVGIDAGALAVIGVLREAPATVVEGILGAIIKMHRFVGARRQSKHGGDAEGGDGGDDDGGTHGDGTKGMGCG
jgi:hypothetical protein